MYSSIEVALIEARKDDMFAYLLDHPEEFPSALRCAVSDHPVHGWRAAWLLSGCMEDNDPRVRPFIPTMLDRLPGAAQGHQRELMKVLLRMELADEHEGALFDMAIAIWEDIEKIPSVRYIAFRFMTAMVRKYPELRAEVKLLTQPHHLKPLSPGIRAAVMKMIRATILENT